MPLAEVLEQPFVAALLPPLLERHHEVMELIRERTECMDGTIYFDITDRPVEGYNKFIPYYPAPGGDVQHRAEQVEFPDQGRGGLEPMDQSETRADGEPGADLRTLRWRGARACGAISFPPDKGRHGPCRCCRNQSPNSAPTIHFRDERCPEKTADLSPFRCGPTQADAKTPRSSNHSLWNRCPFLCHPEPMTSPAARS